jgi:rhodanese-related sulfurtransferase
MASPMPQPQPLPRTPSPSEPPSLPDPLPLEIEPATLADWRAAGLAPVIVDVRETWELAICGFADALHLPLGQLAGREGELPADRPLVVVCHSGRRSLLATRHLRAEGLSVTNLRGGVEAYALAIDPAMARY